MKNNERRTKLPSGMTGFTIVELLVVIVVIAILLTVGSAGYSSMSGRAIDAAVKLQLQSLYKKAQLYKAEHGVFPGIGNGEPPPGFFSFDGNLLHEPVIRPWEGKTHYGVYYPPDPNASYGNFVYCEHNTDREIVVAAWSKTGRAFGYSSQRGLTELDYYDYDWRPDWPMEYVCNQATNFASLGGWWWNIHYVFK